MILCDLCKFISYSGLTIVGVFSIILPIYFYLKNIRKRRNSILPIFVIDDGFGMYYKKNIPGVNLTLKNKGQRAIIKKIEKIDGEIINSTDIVNKVIDNNENILFLIVHDFITEMHINVNVEYSFKVFYRDIDRHIYYQLIEGVGINPKIFPPISVCQIKTWLSFGKNNKI